MRRFPLMPAVVGAVTLLAVVAVLLIVRQNVQQTATLRDHNDLVVHTYQVQGQLDKVLLALTEAESAVRGYFLSAAPASLDRFNQARRDFDTALSTLTQLTRDNPAHGPRVARIREAVAARFAAYSQAVDIRRTQGLDAALLSLRTDEIRRAVADIQTTAAEISSEEDQLLRGRRTQVDLAYRRAVNGRVGSGVASALLLVIVVVLAVAHARSRERRELELVQSERRALEAAEREQEARSEAENANHMKDEFLAVLSHELRTPLNAVLGWTQILQAGDQADPTMRRALASIQRNAEAQHRLVEDLLDVSRIVTGKFPLERRLFELRNAVSAAVDAIRPTADAKGVQVLATLNGPAMTRGDADRLQQMTANLLSNAVKFTPNGGQVDVTLVTRNGDAELTVRDTGCGISAELQPYVFDRFRTGDGSPTRTHGGLGLGLAIVKHIVEAHGGSIVASSDGAGHGATFSVRLPTT